MINETLTLIKNQIGLELPLCTDLPGVWQYKKQKYFNITIKDPNWMSQEYDILYRFAVTYGLIQVSPNGYKRVAIYLTAKGKKFVAKQKVSKNNNG